jgi:hypothetical protein
MRIILIHFRGDVNSAAAGRQSVRGEKKGLVIACRRLASSALSAPPRFITWSASEVK